MSAPEEIIRGWLDRLPKSAARALTILLSLLAGVAVAVMLHYLLYRVGLPGKPFIYVAF